MPDQNQQQTAGQPAPDANAQAASSPAQQFSVPQGHRLVAEQDYERYNRYEQQIRGFQPFWEKASKAGFKSADDFDKYAPLIDTARKRGIDAKTFAAMFSDENGDGQPAKGVQPSFDPEEFKKSVMNEAKLEAHMLRHEDARRGDVKIIESTVSKLLGDGEHDEYMKAMVRGAVEAWMESNRPLYPQGHPLADKYLAPLNDELSEKAIKHFSDMRAKQQGAAMDAAAKNAATAKKPPVSTVAGRSGSGGKPDSIDTSRRPNGLPSKSAVEAAMAARAAARGR